MMATGAASKQVLSTARHVVNSRRAILKSLAVNDTLFQQCS